MAEFTIHSEQGTTAIIQTATPSTFVISGALKGDPGTGFDGILPADGFQMYDEDGVNAWQVTIIPSVDGGPAFRFTLVGGATGTLILENGDNFVLENGDSFLLT